MSVTFRQQLQNQISELPDDIVQQIADFTFFVMTRRDLTPMYADWTNSQWQDFSLEQFFREDDEVEYTLEDAQEIYHP
ncbi:hypothetical protein MNBD_CHLOROFLEXI01-1005 [hydrothermal vent metagenome]|uniref:DUF2281 domain-containing protein n=1 Tax=hydrothermal vent metagenome TaxID=652676 RepID=A0A3B0UKY7_9ZZZZ